MDYFGLGYIFYLNLRSFQYGRNHIGTLVYSNKLQKSGVPREQADAMAMANAEAMQDRVKANELVTQKDLEIALSELKHEILKWVMDMMLAQTTGASTVKCRK